MPWRSGWFIRKQKNVVTFGADLVYAEGSSGMMMQTLPAESEVVSWAASLSGTQALPKFGPDMLCADPRRMGCSRSELVERPWYIG